MSNGGYQRPIMKVPGDFSWAVVQLIKWRDSVKDRRKTMAIQRVIDHKVMWAHEHDMEQSLYCIVLGTDMICMEGSGENAFNCRICRLVYVRSHRRLRV